MSEKSGEQHSLKNMCIIHVDGLKTYSTLKLLSENPNPKERLKKLKDIGVRRMAQPANTVLRMEKSCARLPHQLRPEHGYHRECYQRFTMNLHRLQDVGDNQPSTSKLCHRSSTDNIIFPPDFIFCNSNKWKKVQSHGTWIAEGLSLFEFDGWRTLRQQAVEMDDEKLLRRNANLKENFKKIIMIRSPPSLL